jgi:hypothetical protein
MLPVWQRAQGASIHIRACGDGSSQLVFLYSAETVAYVLERWAFWRVGNALRKACIFANEDIQAAIWSAGKELMMGERKDQGCLNWELFRASLK